MKLWSFLQGARSFADDVSLRARLIVLGVMLALVGLLGLIVAVRLVNSSARAVISNAAAQLQSVVSDMTRDYDDRARYNIARGYGSPLALTPPKAKINPLAVTSALALRGSPGAEGGFYSSSLQEIVGYAFPTYEGSGAKTDAPEAETPTIVEVCEEAISNGNGATRTVGGDREALVFVALPLRENDRITGAAWAMRRIQNIQGEAQRANLTLFLLLALALLATLGFSFLTVRGLRRGVESLEGGLDRLQEDLGTHVKAEGQPELERIASAVNRLARSLQDNLLRRKSLEEDLRRSERLSSLGRLTAGVAHEIRNPLGSMKLKLQLCQRAGFPPEKVSETFNVLEAEINRLDALVARLLELGRPKKLNLETCDLNALIAERASLFSEIAAQSSVEIRFDPPEPSRALELDRKLIAVILDNLIANAIEAMKNGGALTLSWRAESDPQSEARVFLFASDAGPGISAEEIEKIFEPFYTTSDRGVGLGLAIAREAAEAHGGALRVTSDPGHGTTFSLELPLSSISSQTDDE